MNAANSLWRQAGEVAWLINQRALRPYIERGVPFEYTLRGVDDIATEQQIVELIWQGKSDVDIARKFGSVKTRWRELFELYQAGYQQSFDEVLDTYILVKP